MSRSRDDFLLKASADRMLYSPDSNGRGPSLDVSKIWQVVARAREKRGDTAGAKAARWAAGVAGSAVAASLRSERTSAWR